MVDYGLNVISGRLGEPSSPMMESLFQWFAEFSDELTSEVPLREKIDGYASLLLLAFNHGISPHDEDLIAVIPYRLTDPDLLERDKRAREKITNPLIKKWLVENEGK